MLSTSDILMFVDNRDNITETDVIDYVIGICGDNQQSQRIIMMGVARLAGRAQIESNFKEHRRLLKVLKSKYWQKYSRLTN